MGRALIFYKAGFDLRGGDGFTIKGGGKYIFSGFHGVIRSAGGYRWRGDRHGPDWAEGCEAQFSEQATGAKSPGRPQAKSAPCLAGP